MRKFLLTSVCLVCTLCLNGQSLEGQWASSQPIDGQPAFLIMQFEKDSVAVGVMMEAQQSGISMKLFAQCDAKYERDENELALSFNYSTLKASCDVELPDSLKKMLTGDLVTEFEKLKTTTANQLRDEKFKAILPMLENLEILELKEDKLKITTGNFEMQFVRLKSDE